MLVSDQKPLLRLFHNFKWQLRVRCMRFSLLFSYQTHYIIIIDAVIESKKRREPSTYLPYFNIFCSFDRSNTVNFKYLFFSWLDKCYFGNPHISFACWFVCLLGSCEMHTSGTHFDISTQNTNKKHSHRQFGIQSVCHTHSWWVCKAKW